MAALGSTIRWKAQMRRGFCFLIAALAVAPIAAVAQINIGNIAAEHPTDIERTPEHQAKYDAQFAKNKACHVEWEKAHSGAVNADPDARRAFISAYLRR